MSAAAGLDRSDVEATGLAGGRTPAARLRVGVTPAARRRPALSLVAPRRAHLHGAPFVAVLVSMLVAGLLGLLVLNTVLAQGSFALFGLRTDNRVLADREQSLLREVEALRSPQALAARATEMGMVQGAVPAFLRLSDGVVLGTDVAALPPVVPTEAEVAAQAEAAEAAAENNDSDPTTDAEADADQ